MPKRKRGVPISRAVRTAMRVGNWSSVAAAGRARAAKRSRTNRPALLNLVQRVNRIDRAIEIKEAAHRITNVQLEHNNVIVFNNSGGSIFNPFQMGQGVGDAMGLGGERVGDKLQVRGMLFKFFVEGSLARSKVYFRFMLVKMAKGDTLNRANLFKGLSGNKMIDQINTERFTIISQKIVNVSPPNTGPTTISTVTGIPTTNTVSGITGNRIVTMYIPGAKFGRDGNITYENGSATQLKFYDYRLCCVAYDWYGTPQDVNNVGFVNDGYVKLYYKDA